MTDTVTFSQAPDILEGYVDTPILATAFDVSERTIYRWMDAPNGIPHVKVGRRNLFNIEHVRVWLAGRERQRNPTRQRQRLRQLA